MVNRWGKRSVSKTESFLSTFGFLYTFLGLYIIANILLFLRAAVDEAKRHEDFQKYVTSIARGSGATINFNMAVVLLPASRSLVSFLRETPLNLVLPLDKAMPDFHRVVGILLLMAGILHSAMHWVTYIIKSPWSGGYFGFTSLFVTGMILLILLFAIRIAARPAVYKSNYEAFHRIHVGGSVAAYVAIIIHGVHRGTPSTWKWVLGPIIIYTLDAGIRSFREKRSFLLVSKHSAVFQGPDILKIRLPRVFHFIAGQYAELRVPELSRFQWHPFTIASAPHESEMVFYIKAIGNWTISLYELFSERIRNGGHDIEVHIRGPYGAPAQHVGQFDRVIVIGGGVGATPFCSVVKDAYNWITNWTPQAKKRKKPWSAGGNEPLSSKQAEDVETQPPNSLRGRIAPQLKDDQEPELIPDMDNSHIFTTNVYSEDLDTVDLQAIEEREERDLAAMDNINLKVANSVKLDLGRPVESIDLDAVMASTQYTARDYLPVQTIVSSSSDSTELSVERDDSKGTTGAQQNSIEDRPVVPLAQGQKTVSQFRQIPTRRPIRQPQRNEDVGMGSYQANSIGSTRQSIDYMGALYSAYSVRETDELYHKSLDMMVSLSFGSASLIRTIQMKQTQRNIRRDPAGERLPQAIDNEDLSIFHNPRVMFLLFMRSVTVNMIVLWVLLTRFVMAGTAFTFNGLRIFEDGVSLYTSSVLTSVDLFLSMVLSLLLGAPSILEMIELGAAPIHGFDLFVLTPLAFFGVVADILALTNVGMEVELFGIVHIFVLWPILAILVMIRLLRVVGERVSQATSLTRTHASTRAVDFYWTAPTPDDDRWLVNELTPYANLECVQLHRYLTRCTAPPEPRSSRKRKQTPYLHTNYGRPNWNQIFNEMAEVCQNNSAVGVFFCGPPAMAEDVQAACMQAMRNSIVRGLQFGAQAMRGLEAVFGEAVSANEYTGETIHGRQRQGRRGCNVRFVFKRETFA